MPAPTTTTADESIAEIERRVDRIELGLASFAQSLGALTVALVSDLEPDPELLDV